MYDNVESNRERFKVFFCVVSLIAKRDTVKTLLLQSVKVAKKYFSHPEWNNKNQQSILMSRPSDIVYVLYSTSDYYKFTYLKYP